MKGKWRKRGLTLFAALMAGLLMSHGITQLVSDIDAQIVYAETTSSVSFSATEYSANDAGLVLAKIMAKGSPEDTVSCTYRTRSGTAIENVDYVGAKNTVSIKLDQNGNGEYTVGIRCLNDATTREQLRVKDQNGVVHGRYFHLEFVDDGDTPIGANKACICRLAYSNEVTATVGSKDDAAVREIAYLDDYKNMIRKYHKGDNDISGKEHWKTWKEGVSFNDETTRRWVNTYITPGFASAWGSYVLESIDDDKVHSNSNIYMSSGNKQWMEKYSKSSSDPGLSLYYEIEPCTSGGYRLDGKAMYYIAENKNPRDEDGDLVDMVSMHVRGDRQRIWWIQPENCWYSSKDSIYDSVFYKTDPYNGILDYGLAIFNNNKSWDREVHNIWLFLALQDFNAPKVVNQYTEFDPDKTFKDTDKKGVIRIYVRFNEPVYASKKDDLTVYVNGSATKRYADYVEGNYSDTLVYELPAEEIRGAKLSSVAYQLSEDVGDLSYKLNQHKRVENNAVNEPTKKRETTISGGSIDLQIPHLSVDTLLSNQPQAFYDIMVSVNKEQGAEEPTNAFDTGTVYYTWSKDPELVNDTDPASYKYAHVLTSEERGSFGVTLARNESEGITSGFYYLYVLAVSQYGFSQPDLVKKAQFGPYLLDGDAPEISQLSPDPATETLRRKDFRLRIKDKDPALLTTTSNITMYVKYTDVDGAKQVAPRELMVGGKNQLDTKVFNYNQLDGFTTWTYKSNVDADDESIPLDTFMTNLMGERVQMEAEVWFEVVDTATNKAKTSSVRTVFDKRNTFKADINIPAEYVENDELDVGAKVFDIHAALEDSSIGIRFDIPAGDADTRALVDAGAKFSVQVKGVKEFASGDSPYSVTLTGMTPGYYQAFGRVINTDEGSPADLVTSTYSFYLTDAMQDKTTNMVNATGNLVLNNHVFQIEDTTYYYFKSGNSSVGSHLYGATYNKDTDRYEGGSYSPTFSSDIEAKKYMKFMEYQDLELISITPSIASLLNGGSGSTVYVKAPNETKNAQEGQLWVHYKRSSWTATSGTGGWAFYYYGEGNVNDGINVSSLSTNLASAIDAVTNRIVSAGKEVYLVGEDYTSSSTGAPLLSASQGHALPESVSQSHCGTPYARDLTYKGDEALFRSKVTIGGVQYPLATNLSLEVNDSTLLYYKDIFNEDPEKADKWNRLDVADGTLLKNALSQQATGVYALREYGPSGVSEYRVYIDRDVPKLKVTLNKGMIDTESTMILDGEITELSCSTLDLVELLNEDDDQAYVAVFSYPYRNLQQVLYKGDVAAGVTLSEGSYYLVVGDRSGNTASYFVRTSTSKIDLYAQENEAGTGVIVRIENRDASEIASYEVYVNETLIDNEFESSKFYRDSGAYRIEVVDIYGNHETKSVTHQAPSPELTWYYLNDNGGYSTYNSQHPVRMDLKDDPNSPRTTNVYASTYVRVLINDAALSDNIEFEVLGISTSEYTYNSTTGLLAFNSLNCWRLRVWYSNRPESDHTYVFNVDADAPEVAATFVGTTYQPVVEYDANGNVISTSSFDNLNADKYQAGDIATLDTLAYEKTGQGTLSFDDGAIIGGNHVKLTFTDSTSIASVVVTCNGQQIEVAPDENGVYNINGYGEYVVTVTDALGNVAVFHYTNIGDKIANGTIDGEIVDEDILIYGHSDLEVATLYDGTNTIVVHDGTNAYTYEFHNDNGVVTYGQYIVVIQEHYNDETKQIEYIPVGEYQVMTGWSLSIKDESTKRDTWFTVVEKDTFTISLLVDQTGRLRYKVSAVEKEIRVEDRFSTGATHLPNRYVAALSKEPATLVLLSGGVEVVQIESLDYIYITNDLTIDKDKVPDSVMTIEVAYSQTAHIGEAEVIYQNGVWLKDFVGTEFGYYQITATNKYNNKVVYTLNKIEAFASIVTITVLDGSTVTYHDTDRPIYSNKSIELTIMSTEVSFEVNGEEWTEGVVYEPASTRLLLSLTGTYHVRAECGNGVFQEFDFEIKTDSNFLFQEEWIVGYNEEALLRDKGYTNKACSIVLGEDVIFVDMVYNDDTHIVLYDNITDDRTGDTSALANAIGSQGAGKYTVGFRNKYGDLVTHDVYFNDTPSLVLTRTILDDPLKYQDYAIEDALAFGFYSNNLLRFSTTSSTYIFTIDGVAYSLDEPKTIEFGNSSGNGSFERKITFLDEYGNYLEFTATLYRADVAYDARGMQIISLSGTNYTKDDVYITFAEGLKATVSVNGLETKDYVSGQKFYADGEYRFVVRDKAGNRATFTVVHKTMSHYTLTNSTTGEDVIDGGVINNGTVAFSSDDGSKIKYVVRNGELIEEYTSSTFSSTGHYQVLIEDAIGNQAYEEFTIINNSLSTFTYTAPYDYEVTEVWLLADDDTRQLLDIHGKSITLDQTGVYLVVVTNKKAVASFNFSVTIDRSTPTATLVGAKEGEVTARDVSLSGLKVGDVVKIYKDGELISTTTITLSADAPTITTGGKYRIVVTNVQGMTKTFTFTRKSVSNVAGSIFFIVSSGLVVVGLGIGLIYHTKLKTDD